jgi:hypothetical protein
MERAQLLTFICFGRDSQNGAKRDKRAPKIRRVEAQRRLRSTAITEAADIQDERTKDAPEERKQQKPSKAENRTRHCAQI